MTNYFSTILNALKDNGMLAQIFEFKYNSLSFTLVYRAKYESNDSELVFAKAKSSDTLIIPVDEKLSIPYKLKPKTYKKVVNFFEIKYDPENRLTPFGLFSTINSLLKLKPISNYSNRSDITGQFHLSNPDAIYFNYLIDWTTNSSNRHVSRDNREKVQLLLPELYDAIKDLNITVYFTSDYKNNQDEKVDIKKAVDKLS